MNSRSDAATDTKRGDSSTSCSRGADAPLSRAEFRVRFDAWLIGQQRGRQEALARREGHVPSSGVEVGEH